MTKIKKNIVKSVLKGDGGNNKIKKSLGLIEKENLRKRGALLNSNKNKNQRESKDLIHVSSNFHMSDYYYLPYTTFLYIDDRDLLMYFCDFWHDYIVLFLIF